ncbi:MAG: hypothetical protein J6Q87_02850 [Clostridia bacterium]|nr:hypothetical protein [Clostridia bacterium]
MKKEDVILTCYSLLRKETPLSFNCGKICNGKCCKGDEKTGMILFPGEEKFLDENIKIKETEDGLKIAVCNGSCDRNKRPLSCRIYPLFPIVTEDGKIKTIIDLRADCPLKSCDYKFQKSFIRKVKRVGKYLLLNEETKALYMELSDEITEQIELMSLLG